MSPLYRVWITGPSVDYWPWDVEGDDWEAAALKARSHVADLTNRPDDDFAVEGVRPILAPATQKAPEEKPPGLWS